MSKIKIGRSAGRFGVRYGQSARRRIADIETRQRKKQICPLCGGIAKRLSKGIWKCKRCQKKFAGHAYFLQEQKMKSEETQKVLNTEDTNKSENINNKTRKKSKTNK
jgi:large subunit ribosomal protein L37Ae